MDNVFNQNDVMNSGAATNVGGSISKEERKAKINAIKSAYAETVSEDTEFKAKANRLRGSVEMVNTLGYGKGGNIIVDKENSTRNDDGSIKERKLVQTPKIVGYALKNIGNEVIPYTTEVYTKNAEGVYVGEVVQREFKPGETIVLNRKYMTMFCSAPEFGLALANGKMIESSKKKTGSADEMLTSYYFSFSKDLNLDVNSDEVKISIGEDKNIKPEYLETFGYLCNAPAVRERGSKKESGVDVGTMAACYIRKILKEQGMA